MIRKKDLFFAPAILRFVRLKAVRVEDALRGSGYA